MVDGSNLELLNETLFQHPKDHQIKSVRFKWEASFKSYSTNGCILNVLTQSMYGHWQNIEAVILAYTVLVNSIHELLELFFVHEEKLTNFYFVHVGFKSFIGLPSFIGKKSLSCGNQERRLTL